MLVITGKKGEYVVAGSRWCAVWRLVCLACLLAVVLPVFPEKHYAFTPIGASQGLSSNKEKYEHIRQEKNLSRQELSRNDLAD